MTFAHCAARSTPLHFMVNVWGTMVLSVLTHTLVGTKLLLGTIHVTCVNKCNSQIWPSVMFSTGKGLGLILVCMGAFSRGW